MQEELSGLSGGTSADASSATPLAPARKAPAAPTPDLGEGEQLGADAKPAAPQRSLLDYLLGP
jgi:hypothetical protein